MRRKSYEQSQSRISEHTSIRDRFERLTVNEPIPLQIVYDSDTMDEEYVCSTVGKEDN